MKRFHYLHLALAFTASLPAAGQGGHGIEFLPKDRKPAEVERTSDDELKARQEAASGGSVRKNAGKRGFKFEELSTFLTFGGHSVLLPKGAVIHVPDVLARHSVAAIKGELISWQEFLTRYPALVSAVEVTLEEASGEKAFDPERMESAKSGGRILVTVYRRNPVSFHPAPVPAKEEESR